LQPGGAASRPAAAPRPLTYFGTGARDEPGARSDAVRLVSASHSRTQQALASLVSQGLKSESSAMVEELFDNEKRAYSFLAMIPVVGPLFVSASERHTEEEKRRLSVLSIGLTVAILALLWTLQPSPADQTEHLHQRIESEMRVLRNIAEQFRTQNGAYPTVATWMRFADRADARFFDPWGRPYRYELREDGVQLKTLGEDGLEGGSGKDDDFTAEQRPQS
jgi:general secretion pathway protein G